MPVAATALWGALQLSPRHRTGNSRKLGGGGRNDRNILADTGLQLNVMG